MFLLDSQIIYSATDLAAAAECEFAFLHRLDERLGRRPRSASVEDPMSDRLAELGGAHEQQQLQRLLDVHGAHDPTTGSGVYQVQPATRLDASTLLAKHEETIGALRNGADVVFQACFFDGRFHGYADFLIKETSTDGTVSYAVHDTKLAREAKVGALLQIAAYADQLTSAGVAVSERGHLLLGDGSLSSHRLADIVPVYRERRVRLQALVDGHQAGGVAVAWGDDAYVACGRCAACEEEVVAHRDLLMVARMRTSQRKRLIDAGVDTIDALATRELPVDGLPVRSFETLRAQARLQVTHGADDATSGAAGPKVRFDVFDPPRLGCLPPPDPGDIFFDFEGDPLWGGAGSADVGLEYLFGVVETERPDRLRSFWAHDRAAERAALQDFIAYVMDRWTKNPGMHVYHYAPYEKSALLRLAGRHGVCEEEVDALMRGGVLVDLYAVVRESLRVSQRSYSIKQLEPLYMGEDLRVGDVTTAGDSIISYHRYRSLRAAGQTSEAEAELKGIADYNHYDCASTLRLRNWLLDQARRHGVALGAAISDTEVPHPAEEPDDLAARLFAEAETAASDQRSPDQHAWALLGAALGYHRREDKPFWWTYFDRLRSPIDEWVDTRDCFVPAQVSMVEGWHKSGRQRKLRRHLRITGRLETGSELQHGTGVHCIYDAPVPDGVDCPQGAVRGTTTSASIVSVGTNDEGSDVLVVEELLSDGMAEHDVCPVAICGTPGPLSANLVAAIRELAEHTVASLPDLPAQPALDVLRRRTPRTRSGTLPAVGAGDNVYIDAITRAAADLTDSYLAVQGPPGTGKTYTGARAIERLVREHGWRVGVVAQSHSVVANMLDEVVAAGVDPGRVGKKTNGGDTHTWTSFKDTEYAAFLDEHSQSGCVIGGTAWDFTNLNRVQRRQLDLLVIDEAGQFSLANTVAVSVSARRLLLLGDPQQLPQVSQGRHPEPVDGSALGWLAEGHGALPRHRGYFLERSWRMHPALCEPVSQMSYDGRLRSQERVTTSRCVYGMAPGLQVVEVRHQGNSVQSPEEASAVVAQVQALVGRTWTDPQETRTPRPLAARDVVVVAPYNAQVGLIHRELNAVGLPDVRVGTVDKLQGRQAPVVIVSMTASAVGDIPRGMSFLLSRNRVNVAVSRAKYATVIIRSPALTNFLPATPGGLAELGAFVGLCDSASSALSAVDQPSGVCTGPETAGQPPKR